MKILGIIVILMSIATGVWGSERIIIRQERTPDREYYQQNSSGGTEKVKEYRNGTTVKEGFRYESGKGIIKYNEAQPKMQPQDTRTKEKSRGK